MHSLILESLAQNIAFQISQHVVSYSVAEYMKLYNNTHYNVRISQLCNHKILDNNKMAEWFI